MNKAPEIIQQKMKERLRYRPLLAVIDKVLVVVPAASLFAFLIYVFIHDRTNFFISLLLPASGFILLTIFRTLINAPRPYEVYGYTPVIPKETKGNSFPSRHVFSCFLIAMTVLRVSLPFGAALFAVGILISVIRVFTGVHFKRDVIAGAAFAILYSLIFYGIIHLFS